MSKYIERDAAVKAAIYGADDWDGGFNRSREMYIEKAINNVPTVDAVPVVRCKDCKFNYSNQFPYDGLACQKFIDLPIREDFFCAYGAKADGERRTE